MMLEVEQANKMPAVVKAKGVQVEKDLDNAIADYNKQRAIKEGERIREERRLKDEKERETQKLREL